MGLIASPQADATQWGVFYPRKMAMVIVVSENDSAQGSWRLSLQSSPQSQKFQTLLTDSSLLHLPFARVLAD